MKHELRHTGEDQTREVRAVLNSDFETLEFEGKANTHGMLSEDVEREYFTSSGQSLGFIGDVGAGKILYLKNQSNKVIKGGEFHNSDIAFPYDQDFGGRRHHITSENAFLEIENCNDISLIGQKYTGPNHIVRESTGYPHFRSKYEYEHVIDLSASENILIQGWDASHAFGDFVYFRKGAKRSKNITIKDCKANFIARQGVGFGDGENILIENFKLTLGGRGFVDVEPPKQGYKVKNLIVRNSPMADVWLLPAPMGGLGTAENILYENNVWTTQGPNTYMEADRVNSFRKNIIFRGNKRLSGYGTTDGGVITAKGVEGLLIEDEFAHLKAGRALTIAYLDYCTNVTIRSSDFPNAKYIVLKDTPIEEVKVYGNIQKDLEFKIYEFDIPFMDAPSLEGIREELKKEGITRNSLVWQAWLTERENWFTYNAERNSRATFRYVPVEDYNIEYENIEDILSDQEFQELDEKFFIKDASGIGIYGSVIVEMINPIDTEEDIISMDNYFIVREFLHSDVPKDPDFIPYMGKVEPEPTPEEPTPEPETPTDPLPEPEVPQEPETPKPPVEQPEKPKEWYENKLLWVIGGIALTLILIALL